MDTRRLRAAIFERSGIAIDEHDPIMAVVAACAQQTEEIGALLLRRANPVRTVVAVMVALLGVTLMTALAKSNPGGNLARCLNNHRQLTAAWTVYSFDFKETLISCQDGVPGNRPNWCTGDLDFSASNNSNWDPNADITRSPFWPYTGRDTSLYRCPSDKSLRVGSQTPQPRVRSYSMNAFMGGRDPKIGPLPATATGYVPFFVKDSDLRHPYRLWVMIDEDETTINDGFFLTDPDARNWLDLPAKSAHRHSYSFPLTFADGHTDAWPHHRLGGPSASLGQNEQHGGPDLQRLAEASTSLK